MILETQKLQKIITKILWALDTDNSKSNNPTEIKVGDKLELVVNDGKLYLNVTNKDYYVRATINDVQDENFRAVVNAKLFLNLISKLTTEQIELTTTSTVLIAKANGSYKFPLIYEGNELLKLEEININNPTATFDISTETLASILNFNLKELNKSDTVNPIQKLIYIDELGCLTFTTGACVNNFSLKQPIKLLLNQKLVKLFKLFEGEYVKFTIGYDQLKSGLIQTKVRFENDDIVITSITATEESLLGKFPVKVIREMVKAPYPYQMSIDRVLLSQALSRLLLFNTARDDNNKDFGTIKFESDKISIFDSKEENKEEIDVLNSNLTDTYESSIDINNLKAIIDNCNEDVLLFSFGNSKSFVLSRGNIINLIPESRRA